MTNLATLPWHLLPVGLGAGCALMVLLWVVGVRLRNAAIVDVGWSFLLGALAVFYAAAADGAPSRRVALAVIVGAWSLRLTIHIFFERVWKQPEEGRYAKLREHWGADADRNLVGFFLGQAVLASVLSVTFLLVASDARAFFQPLDLVALAVFMAGWIGEAVADRQLKRFKADPDNRGLVMNRGLWRWSRHPNYFFEWLMWCAYGVLALPARMGWIGLVSPVLMYVFITRLTGIPTSEAQALRSRGDAYRRYQETTSAFVPWPPSHEKGAA